jgi:hypothetical protein
MVIRNPKPHVEYDPMKDKGGSGKQWSGKVEGGVWSFSPVGVSVEIVDDQLKRGMTRVGEVMCDEGPNMGGQDSAPSPLDYFTLGILF